jgi:xanthine dehydrogenase YagS FAD-binding subunit
MRPFSYERVHSPVDALRAAGAATPGAVMQGPPTLGHTQYLAGGTTILDLMKLDVMRPAALVDINDLDPAYARIERRADGLHLGALVKMGEAADHAEVKQHYPVIAQSLQLAASPQLRNMATLGGNVLQRTRCNYFRDTAWAGCNKREPGSGCAALDGVNRKHAILGVSDHCIATYPGDFAQALIALDATVEILGPKGARLSRFEHLHRAPGDAPEIETSLAPGEIILRFKVPASGWSQRSLYLKVRDRQSYEFALASAAVALDLADDGAVRQARIALGGLATKPWRAREAEAVLVGRPIDQAAAQRAADAAFATAVSHGGNDFKRELGRRTVVRALLQASTMSI